MATTVFGMPGVECVNPSGEVVAYVCRPVPATAGSWREWCIVKADGTEYRVREFPSGRWSCTCAAAKYRKPGACKHILGLQTEVGHAAGAPATGG